VTHFQEDRISIVVTREPSRRMVWMSPSPILDQACLFIWARRRWRAGLRILYGHGGRSARHVRRWDV